MKQKHIHEFLVEIVKLLTAKVNHQAESEPSLPDSVTEYTKGQLYEAQYILSQVENIIYSDAELWNK